MLDTFRHDLRYTVRGLRAKPAFTMAVVVTLALGIGANAAMFGIVDRMLFRPPPMLRDPATAHRLYYYSTSRGKETAAGGGQYARYLDFAGATKSFSSFAGYTEPKLAVGVGENAREMSIGVVSSSFFGFFDAPPVLGRYFTTAEDSVPAGQPVAVVSHTFWNTKFGGRADVLGSKVQIGSTIYTIIGVTPAGFAGLWPDQPPVAYIPITGYGASQAASFRFVFKGVEWWQTYHWGWMSVIARRRPGVSIEAANAELSNAARLSYQRQVAENDGKSTPIALVKPHAIAASILSERGPRESSVAKVATWVGGVSLIVLLIACANVANLLLARALRRRREIAVRLALGVSRSRLLSQLLTESVMLALLGAAVGLLVAQWGGAVLRSVLLTESAPTVVFRDPRTILFAGGAALIVGILSGLAPIAQTFRASRTLVGDLRSGAREGTQRSALRAGLLLAQAALSVILLVGAGLFVRSLRNVRSTRLGYDVDPVMLVELNMRGEKLDSAAAYQLRHRLLESAKTIPGVTHASLTVAVPFWSTWSTRLYVAGIDTVGRLGQFDLNAVTPDYFATMGTRIVRGRAFNDQDSYTAPKVMIVSQGMARVLWPGENAIGKCVRMNADTTPCISVVGLSEDIRQESISADSGLFTYYVPAEQLDGQGGLMLRVAGDAHARAESVRRALQREMPRASYVTTTPFREIVGSQTKSWELGATMFAAFGALALTLASIGLYSVIAYNVAQRTHEMGVRVALGAQARDVVRLVVRQGVALGAIGLVIGSGVALGAARWVKPLLFNESASDPFVFAFVTLTLLAVAVAASWIPARRAARIDPQIALRSE